MFMRTLQAGSGNVHTTLNFDYCSVSVSSQSLNFFREVGECILCMVLIDGVD